MTLDDDAGRFARLHSLFTFHLGIAVGLSWLTATYAAFYAPWVRNIRPLISPSYEGPVESTWSFLFVFPAVLTVSWLVAKFGKGLMQRVRLMKSDTAEFAVAAAVALTIFYLSVDRAVSAILLAA
jgi:hypothetical protein